MFAQVIKGKISRVGSWRDCKLDDRGVGRIVEAAVGRGQGVGALTSWQRSDEV